MDTPLMVLNDTQFASMVNQGGATRVAADRSQAPDSGYYVALPGHEQILSHASKAKVARHRERILKDPEAPKYQGGWKEHNQVYLDASDRLDDRAQAILQGHIQQQKSIYDANTDDVLYMKDHPPKMPARVQ